MSATWAQALLTLALVFIFLGFLVWGIRTGQFRNIEESKYRIFDDKGGREEDVNKQADKKEDRG